jgi:hypothetical protein
MAVERKYERDIDLLLAEEFAVSSPFAKWFLQRTKKFRDQDANVLDVYVSKSDATGESDLVVVFEKQAGESRFALLIEDKIDAPLQAEQECRYTLRGDAEIARGDYSEYEVILCAPERYRDVHPETVSFDSFVSCEIVNDFLRSQAPNDKRSVYRANFVSTAAKKSSNTWTRVDDAVTNAFWRGAYEIATREFPDLEMKPLELTKDSTWVNVRPLDMPSVPRRIYISLKCDRGFLDLTFTNSLARLFQPQVAAFLDEDMTVHQTGKSAAIRLVVDGFGVAPPEEAVLAKVRASFAAAGRLVHFYRRNKDNLNKAAAASLPEPGQ